MYIIRKTSKNIKTSELRKLMLNLADKIYLKSSDKYVE